MAKWTSKMWYKHTIKYYSVFKRKEILSHVVTWKKLDDITRNEKSSHNKTNAI
jgi:hypothetical protein